MESMLHSDARQAQRAELEAVLASEAFRRAPTLARILEYLCERQMRGETFIKEYEIAVQVMGRHSSFDPQQDGSVRVNLHHLRKKLKHYYEGEGSSHTLWITLPIGQSLPSFENMQTLVPMEDAALPTAEQAEPLPVFSDQPPAQQRNGDRAAADPHTAFENVSVIHPSTLSGHLGPAASTGVLDQLKLARVLILACVIASALVASLVTWQVLQHRSAKVPIPLFLDAVIRIGCGQKTAYRDEAGRVWARDADFRGGQPFRRVEPIAGTSSPELYLRGREGDFSYDLPLPEGRYELHLYFAETAVHGEGFRSMSIAINGQQAEEKFDVTSDAGGFAAATEKIYPGVHAAPDGKLHLSFKGISLQAFVNAVEIMPSNGELVRPIRQSTLTHSYIDPQGTVWMPDEWFHGGRTIDLHEVFPTLNIQGFYQHERFGNFTYSIPVAPNRTYSLTLYFQDLWFSQIKKLPATERRAFDVSCNTKELLHHEDILAEAGDSNYQLRKHFSGLTPSPTGKLLLAFTPSQNYATVNAIEIEEEPATPAPAPR